MSSHHIVRDNQEPALAIVSGDFSGEILLQLLEWGPTVCITGPAVERVLSLNINVDALFYEDPRHATLLSQAQAPLELVPLRGEPPLESIIEHLTQKGHKALNILGLPGPSLFREAAVRYPSLKIVNFTDEGKSFLAGENYMKWYSSGMSLRFFSPDDSEYTILGSFISPAHGSITTTADGMIRIQTSGILIVEEDL